MPNLAQRPSEADSIRRFACTGCGKCCDRGPEIELSEASDLAGVFVTSLLFKVHRVPLSERSQWAADYCRRQGSRLPLRPALEERRRHLRQFASKRRSERSKDRELYLTISAIVDDYTPGRCPALADGLCGIYESRPLTCRTVPLHYSRQPSALRAYIDQFTATPGYRCDITDAPIVLDGNKVVDPEVRRDRESAVALAQRDRPWKAEIVRLMDDPRLADLAGLPAYDAVVANTDAGYASLVPMLVAWRVARSVGLISAERFRELCEQQASLLRAEIARGDRSADLVERLLHYDRELQGASPAPSVLNKLP